jgi:CRP-like cAMP-binding protein
MNGLSLTPRQIIEILGRLSLFKALGDETLENLAVGARQVRVARNESIFQKGELATSMHMIVGGQVRIYLPLTNGSEKVIASIGPGEAFGVAAACLMSAHPAHAVANKDSHLLLVDRHVLMREARSDCNLALRLLGEVSRNELSLVRDLESCTPRSAHERVACFLLQHRLTEQDAFEVHLPTTKREIAAKLNITHETFSRVLHHLCEEEIISVKGRLVSVLDSARLDAINKAGCPHEKPIPE